jgi:hypothetical protein
MLTARMAAATDFENRRKFMEYILFSLGAGFIVPARDTR